MNHRQMLYPRKREQGNLSLGIPHPKPSSQNYRTEGSAGHLRTTEPTKEVWGLQGALEDAECLSDRLGSQDKWNRTTETDN